MNTACLFVVVSWGLHTGLFITQKRIFWAIHETGRTIDFPSQKYWETILVVYGVDNRLLIYNRKNYRTKTAKEWEVLVEANE